MNTVFSGKKVLITAGPTYEPIDPVRFIGNHSTGKMGLALAEAFADRGAEVELVMGPSSLVTQHPNIHRTDVMTARQMFEACQALFPACQLAILSAAVADYRVANVSDKKIKKTDGTETLTLELVKNEDILAQLGRIKQPNQVLGGFSLETHNELSYAREKLQRKNCNFIVMNSLNDAGAGFGTDTNKVTIITANDEISFSLKSKKEVAGDIADFVQMRYFGRNIV